VQDGALYANNGFDCDKRDGTLYAFEDPATGDDKFFAISGEKIQSAADSAAYDVTWASCFK